MVNLSNHPPQTSVASGFKRKLDFGRDIEPMITKYHLENNDDCKEAVELIKKGDPKGYNQLGVLFINNVHLTLGEQRNVFLMCEKAVNMGLEDARFNLGGLYLVGAGVRRDHIKGITMIESVFLKVFSMVFPNYPLDSEESTRLRRLHDYFILGMDEVNRAAASKDYDELKEGYHKLLELQGLITYVYENHDISVIM